jgi:predicted transposase/invertase (TIGR01784 family)
MKIIKAHDKFFKEIFSNKEEAIGLLKNTLPKKIVENIDFRTLKLDNTSYVDDELSEYFADLVFDAKYKVNTKIKLSILIEHKSNIPKNPYIQLLKYIWNIWNYNSEKSNKKLTPILPIIVYAGKYKWEKRDLSDYFEGLDEHLLSYQPLFDYKLVNVSGYSDKEMQELFQAFNVRAALLTMKKMFEDVKNFTTFAEIFIGLDDIELTERQEGFLKTTMVYIVSNTDKDIKEIIEEITKVSKKGGKLAMTTATRLREQGMQQGIQKAKIEDIINLYSSGRFTIEEVAKFLKVSIKFVKEAIGTKQN